MFRSLPQTRRTTGHGLAIHLALLWVVGKPEEKSLDRLSLGSLSAYSTNTFVWFWIVMDCVSLLTAGLNLFAFIISEWFDFPFLYSISFCNSVVIPDYVILLKGFVFLFFSSFKRQIIQMYNTSLRNIAANYFCLNSYNITLFNY